MMRSLFSGVSGLRNHQTRMDVIGNNIANVNTVGYKSSRVSFQDVLSQTLSGASSATAGRGGTNPKQVGLGMGLASIDTIFTDGSFQPTGKQTDLSIQGQGFFILSDGNNQVYTRAGNFDFDEYGNYLVPGTGYQVMGWMADATGTVDTNAPITTIQIPVGSTMAASATAGITYANNLLGEAPVGAASLVTTSITAYDGQGNAHKFSATLQKTAANTWTYTPISPCDTGATVTVAPTTLVFDPTSGALVSVNGVAPDAATQTAPGAAVTVTPVAPFGAAAFTFTPDFFGVTQYGSGTNDGSGESTVTALGQDGYPSGTLDRITIDTNGVIQGRFTNGESENLARVALANFNNPGGLTKVGTSLYIESNNSGVAQIGASGSGGRGDLSPGSLEMSNVDLAEEFSNMIITQRGFQANSKIITTTDEMLQELANLKR